MLAYLGQNAIRAGATRLVGEFIPTKKNAPCADFYLDHGFTQNLSPRDGSPDSIFYQLDLTTAAPESPRWLTLEGNESNEFSASAVVAS